MPRISADERRRQLVEAALRVMEREGVAAATTRAIVSEAGMALAAFHYCFRSRDELLRELMLTLTSSERSAVSAAMVEEGGDLRTIMGQAAYAYLAHLQANPGREQVMFELNHYALRTPALHDLAQEQYRAYYATTQGVLAAAEKLAGVQWTQPIPVLARMIVTITDGLTTTWLADRDTAKATAALDLLLDYIATLAVPA